jgi:hypothetical protein
MRMKTHNATPTTMVSGLLRRSDRTAPMTLTDG